VTLDGSWQKAGFPKTFPAVSKTPFEDSSDLGEQPASKLTFFMVRIGAGNISFRTGAITQIVDQQRFAPTLGPVGAQQGTTELPLIHGQ
jgi:hypothetical protein